MISTTRRGAFSRLSDDKGGGVLVNWPARASLWVRLAVPSTMASATAPSTRIVARRFDRSLSIFWLLAGSLTSTTLATHAVSTGCLPWRKFARQTQLALSRKGWPLLFDPLAGWDPLSLTPGRGCAQCHPRVSRARTHRPHPYLRRAPLSLPPCPTRNGSQFTGT